MTVSTGSLFSSLIRRAPLLVILLAAIAGAIWLGDAVSFETLQAHRGAILGWSDSQPFIAAGGFVAVYFIVVALSLPGATILSVTGGFLFGLWFGTALNIFAATLGAAAIFQAARMGLGDTLVARLDGQDTMLNRLREGMVSNAVSVLLMMRLVPVLPFFVVNLLPALAGVRFVTFVWTTAIGIIPGAFVFTSIGTGLGDVFDRGETPDLSILWEPQVILPLLGLAALAALPMIFGRKVAPAAGDEK